MSGGLDSAILIQRLLTGGNRVWPLYLACGFIWEDAEVYWLTRFLKAVRSSRLLSLAVVQVPMRSVYGAHWSLTGRSVPGTRSADAAVYLPGRNVLLVSYAAILSAQRGISRIALGTLAGNPFGDASPSYFRRMSAALTQALRHPIRIEAPLRRLTKRQLIRAAGSLPLGLTFSCLRPRGRRHCGRCNKCAERRRAFRAAGMLDPTDYAT